MFQCFSQISQKNPRLSLIFFFPKCFWGFCTHFVPEHELNCINNEKVIQEIGHFPYILILISSGFSSKNLLQPLNKIAKNKESCCVEGCYNNTWENPEIIYHHFPSNKLLREEWRKKCNKSLEFVATKNSNNLVCGRHFRKEDYFKVPSSSGKYSKWLIIFMEFNFKFQFSSGIIQYGRILLRNAVPSLFLLSESTGIKAVATSVKAIGKFVWSQFHYRWFIAYFWISLQIMIGVSREF